MNKKLYENEKTWNSIAEQFKNASALPIWGPFGIGDDFSKRSYFYHYLIINKKNESNRKIS